LELLLYCNQLQLATTDALYSYGKRYEPAKIVARELKGFLPGVQKVLIMGAGLGSLLLVLRDQGFTPQYTFVDIDEVVLKWAMESLQGEGANSIEAVCSGAEKFIENNTAKFDLVFIDIFNGMAVPDFVITTHFLARCKDSLAAGGRLAFNYISNKEQGWEGVKRNFASVFPEHTIISKGVNKVFITG
jgi:spermidine synthase